MNDYASMPSFEGFDWSGGNAEKNWQRHQVSPWESEQVFFNQPLFIAEDKAHSVHELRYYVLGKTDEERELFIVFTLRNKKIRVISSRDMSSKERRIYRTL
ncbi:MAG TPA: BrnT family toxin [Candidatus Hydrogenedentes bacterium]|nr:BrnT family toxin [Candidatus Hydrogenedentota bacterium]